ncbi:hypothetical protein EKE94_12320 [Mesobaculum littorinae]|uniref:Four-carbon acid sugar kinase family protein n=1 Tax=Mesobaculum littorinae TaxID=2486419 RepID=A0A438AF57_9RHOB|nr:four-carbon acid sugar kinase family protein [Mesobaculum littorinae]RVV97346.1 hypothetical protein EKE94_12320 [Mesobaculum littorinae]
MTGKVYNMAERMADSGAGHIEDSGFGPQVLVIADDLTGTLDSAVAFAGPGRRVCVARRVEAVPQALATGAAVIAVNTASREIPEAEALARLQGLFAMLDLGAVPLVFKKVDSRLKGHVAAESRAVAQAAGAARILALPAIPDMGRVQQGGQITGTGVDRPIDIADRFGGGARDGIEVPEAGSDAEIDACVAGAPGGTLWAGARGLAFALARARFGAAGQGAVPFLPAPAIFALGSRDPITVVQAEELADHAPRICAPDGLLQPGGAGAPLTLVQLTDGGAGRPAREAGADFAHGVAALVRESGTRFLLASGGETADAILDRLGIDVVDVMAELAPGLPVCSAPASWGSFLIATKSGGFGAPDLLCRLAGWVGQEESGAPAEPRKT